MPERAVGVISHPPYDRFNLAVEKMTIRMQPIAPFDARSRHLRRSRCHGIDIHHGREKASADFWNTPQGETLARFTRGDRRSHFQLIVSGPTAAAFTTKQFENAVQERLDSWFFDADND